MSANTEVDFYAPRGPRRHGTPDMEQAYTDVFDGQTTEPQRLEYGKLQTDYVAHYSARVPRFVRYAGGNIDEAYHPWPGQPIKPGIPFQVGSQYQGFLGPQRVPLGYFAPNPYGRVNASPDGGYGTTQPAVNVAGYAASVGIPAQGVRRDRERY